MWLKGRIIFSILACIAVTCVIPFGALLSWTWAGIAGLSAFLFYALMIFCKNRQPQEQQADSEETEEAQDESTPQE